MVEGCEDTDLVITGGAAWYRVHSVRAVLRIRIGIRVRHSVRAVASSVV